MRGALFTPPVVVDATAATTGLVGRGPGQRLAEHRVDPRPVHRRTAGFRVQVGRISPAGAVPAGVTPVRTAPVPTVGVRHSSSISDNCATTYETSGHSVAIPSRIAARLGARLATTVLPDTPT